MQVDFHLVAGDVYSYVCRLVRKAAHQAAPLCITGDANSLRRASRALWQASPTSFLAHAGDWDPAQVQALASVWLYQQPSAAPSKQVLVRLGADEQLCAEAGYSRLIEIVAADDQNQVQQARARWRQYQAQGHSLKLYEIASRARP